MSPSKDRKIKFQEVEIMTTVQKIFYSGEDYEKDCYFFSPSISKRKTVSGKTNYVRRYFRGGKDFENAMAQLATNKIKKIVR